MHYFQYFHMYGRKSLQNIKLNVGHQLNKITQNTFAKSTPM